MTFVSKKLRTLMGFVPVEVPALRTTLSGKARELGDTLFGSVALNQLFKVVANQLVQAFAERFGFASSALNQAIINGKSDIHEHIVRVHILCVKLRVAYSVSFLPAAAATTDELGSGAGSAYLRSSFWVFSSGRPSDGL